nr:hypothetical protein [Tanacetum cinerariifolium]
MIGRGLRLAVMKCGESIELRQAFADVMSARIAKGLSEGIKHGVEHWHAKLDLEALEAYDPEAEAKYLAALHALKNLKYPLVDQLEGLKDAPMDVIMASLHLESDTGDDAPQWVRDSVPVLSSSRSLCTRSRAEKKKKCRLRFKQEAKLLKKSVAQVARRDKRIQARENEIKNLETLLEAEADMKKAAEDKSVKLSQVLKNMRALFSDLQDVTEGQQMTVGPGHSRPQAHLVAQELGEWIQSPALWQQGISPRGYSLLVGISMISSQYLRGCVYINPIMASLAAFFDRRGICGSNPF